MRIQPLRIAGSLAALCLVLAAAVLPSGAEEPRVYTNADLAALPKLDLPQAPPMPVARPAAKALPSLAYEPPRLESRAAITPAREEAIFFAESSVERARAVVDELQAKLRAVEDPFLPRPLLTAEEQRAWLHLDNVWRARVVEAQIARATADLVEAESLLARLRGEV